MQIYRIVCALSNIFAGFVFVNWTLGQDINSSVRPAEENAGVLIIKSPKSVTIRLLMQLSQQKRYQTFFWDTLYVLNNCSTHLHSSNSMFSMPESKSRET